MGKVTQYCRTYTVLYRGPHAQAKKAELRAYRFLPKVPGCAESGPWWFGVLVRPKKQCTVYTGVEQYNNNVGLGFFETES